MARFVILLLCVLGLAGCLKNKPCADMGFGRFGQTSRIAITNNNGATLRVVRGAKATAPFVAFAQAHTSGWSAPAAGTPVALVNMNFYAGNEFLGNLGVGNTFLTAQGCGGFVSRPVSHKDRKAIMRLAAVPDPYSE